MGTAKPGFIAFLLCASALVGCQQYRRRPLDLREFDRAWRARDPAEAEVRAYADRLLAPSGDGHATYDPSDGISVREAEAVALFFNPQLRVARLRADAARAGADEAGRWEDPQLGVDAERILAGVAEPWVLAGTIAVTLPISGRLPLEKGRAAAEADVERLRALVEERSVLADLRDEWLLWSATLERTRLTNELLAELEHLAGAAEQLRQAGELDPTDARLFRIEQVAQRSRLQAHETEARDLELGIRARLGLVPDAPIVLVPDVQVPPNPPPAGRAFDADGTPRLRLARAQYEVAERSLRLEVRRQYPDLALHGGYGTDEGDERVLLGGSLPLPLLNGNRRAIAEARANREAARAAAGAEYQDVVSSFARARAKADAAASRLEFVRRELAPLGDQQLADVRRLGRLGDFNSVLILDALKAAHDTKLELLQARLESSQANNRVNSLVETTDAEVRP